MKFSIICLTYKRNELLEECIYSVLNQTYTNWELLIINDCSDQIYRFDNPKVKIFNLREKIKNLADKRNYAKSMASGDYILNLDDDDLLLPTYLENIKKLSKDCQWIKIQRPILYYNDVNKIHLSPVPQANTFVYHKNISSQFEYKIVENDELTSFYLRTEMEFTGSKVYALLKPQDCGYVWRQDIDDNRKYSMTKVLRDLPEEMLQNNYLNSIAYKPGEIWINPHWNCDYVSIIKNNLKVLNPALVYDNKTLELSKIITKNLLQLNSQHSKPNNWQKVKPSWENATKFLNSIKSRGLVSTALDAAGINSTLGERVSNKILHQRKLSCFGSDVRNIPKCDRLKHIDGKGFFCDSCGCGDKDLARLDADSPEDYTKLHYPYLECPLEKPGFSNEKIVNGIESTNFNINVKSPVKFPLSVVIPALNESKILLNNTIESIKQTTSNNVEIIVVDDFSEEPVIAATKVIRNEKRMGTGLSRHIGAIATKNDYILFSDAHMIFENGWYENVMDNIDINNKNTAYCGVCLGLNEKQNQTLNNYRGAYYGAKLVLYDEIRKTLFEGRWIPEIKNNDNYEIACMMGAMYFVPKELYFKVRGFSDLRMWGSLEPCLCTKIWLSGGEVRLLKSVRAGHVFRSSAPYSTKIAYLVYNKIRLAKSLLPEKLSNFLISKLSADRYFNEAMELIKKDQDEINEYIKYYRTIFVRDIYWLDKKFGISMPKEFINYE